MICSHSIPTVNILAEIHQTVGVKSTKKRISASILLADWVAWTLSEWFRFFGEKKTHIEKERTLFQFIQLQYWVAEQRYIRWAVKSVGAFRVKSKVEIQDIKNTNDLALKWTSKANENDTSVWREIVEYFIRWRIGDFDPPASFAWIYILDEKHYQNFRPYVVQYAFSIVWNRLNWNRWASFLFTFTASSIALHRIFIAQPETRIPGRNEKKMK